MDNATPMNINAANSSSIPFHIAKAYGVRPTAQVSRPNAGAQQSQETSQASQASNVAAGKKLSPAARALIAAVVPGKVDFSGDEPRQAGGAGVLQMYRHPADKNAAATAVNVGRTLDVSG